MQNFTYHNPTKVVFGKGQISELGSLVPKSARVLLTYGGGSIKRNGVYEQVKKALNGHEVLEFGGIEANPQYETCMKAVTLCREKDVNFLLAVGGGSVIDGTKFIAAAVPFTGQDPWSILSEQTPVSAGIPMGCVLTLPATGSESNAGSVMSHHARKEKLFFISPHVQPRFCILDPETTFSLPERQFVNGVVDTYVHVIEQYLTYPAAAPLQDRQAEGILQTLVEYAPQAKAAPRDYDLRATLMWCATQALNNLIGSGVPQDWTTHMIGHELTAFYGIDHAQSLAIVLPGVLKHQLGPKKAKLLQYAERVWRLSEGSEDARALQAIEQTESFFRGLGMKTRLAEYDIPEEACSLVAKRLGARGVKFGEHQAVGASEVEQILKLRL